MLNCFGKYAKGLCGAQSSVDGFSSHAHIQGVSKIVDAIVACVKALGFHFKQVGILFDGQAAIAKRHTNVKRARCAL